jgi:hypothetical protein
MRQPNRGMAAARAVAVLLLVSGCTAIRPVRAPTTYIESMRPKFVRITRTDGSRFVMIGAHLHVDTLMGFVEDGSGKIGEFQEVPVHEISKVEAQQWAPARTVLAITGGLFVCSVIIYAVKKHEDSAPVSVAADFEF